MSCHTDRSGEVVLGVFLFQTDGRSNVITWEAIKPTRTQLLVCTGVRFPSHDPSSHVAQNNAQNLWVHHPSLAFIRGRKKKVLNLDPQRSQTPSKKILICCALTQMGRNAACWCCMLQPIRPAGEKGLRGNPTKHDVTFGRSGTSSIVGFGRKTCMEVWLKARA